MAIKKITLDWIIDNYMEYFKQFQLTEQNIRTYFEEWKSGKDVVLPKDFLWHIFQLIVQAIAKQATSEEQLCLKNMEVYWKMWEFLVKVENRNGDHVLRSKFKNELRLWQLEEKTFKQQVEIISGHCCPFCNSLDGKIMSIEEALESQPLASKQCTRKWGCNCCYSVTGVRDSEGRLVMI